MRGHLVLLAGLGFLLSSACDNSTTDGGSGTGGTTTAGTTGGSTTGGTNGGTTGGTTGGNLAAGTACTGNTQCTSGICGINGGGRCCTAACAHSDQTCGATACDMTGACFYPATTVPCGTDSCNNGTLTQSACDAHGACLVGTPAPCTGDFQCADAMSCRTACTLTVDCATNFYCTTNHKCLAKVMNGACTTNEGCTSGICGISGTGNCCISTMPCAAAADPACDPTSCDVASGACVYPSGNACGTPSCTGNILTASTCDPVGACNSAAAPCPNNLLCAPLGLSCLGACGTSADCVSGFYCSAARCVPQVATGACNTNEACTTGLCGPHGIGHCCTAACDTTDPSCGSRDCDNTGACTFPNNKSACGLAASCTGTTQTNPTTCDGKGACQPQGTTDCTPYICGVKSCLASCNDNTSCTTGDFCDTKNVTCCSVLANNGTLAVDSTTGSDVTACCGIGTNGACQTLAHAMALIDAAQAQNVTINATVNGGGGDWPAGDTYPIRLGWGVELNAPGVFFLDPKSTGVNSILDINFYSKNDTVGYASIVGSAKSQVGVGMDSANMTQTFDTASIAVEAGNKLYIANASVNSSASNAGAREAFLVQGGGTLVLGNDQSGAITGTVNIGNALGQKATDGFQGITCATDVKNLVGCTVMDVSLGGPSAVVIQGQEDWAISADDFASISLTANPVIGIPPSGAGFGNCPQKADAQISGDPAVLLTGSATMTFNNGFVQCLTGTGFFLQTSPNGNGNPTLNIDSSTIQNTDLGISAQAGTATVTNTAINFNYNGVLQATDGTNNGKVDLSGGGNAVICSSNKESSQGNNSPGIDVYNTSTASLPADNVAWDTSGPDYFSCDPAFQSCVCNLASCATSPNNDDMDAVEDNKNLAGITTTNPTVSASACK
jgi:hypothetical protein